MRTPKTDVEALQQVMCISAERQDLPKRFTVRPANNAGNAMWITDTTTHRRTKVWLCDYHGVRKALSQLFR